MPITRKHEEKIVGEVCTRCGDDDAAHAKQFRTGPGGGPQCADLDACDTRREANLVAGRRGNETQAPQA